MLLCLFVLWSQLLSLNYSIRLFLVRQYGPSGFYTIYLLLLSVLPVLNAEINFLSVKVTRGFLRHVAQKKPCFWIILTQALCDLVVGFVCLALLLAMLVSALDLWQRTGLRPDFNWRAYWADTQKTSGIMGSIAGYGV